MRRTSTAAALLLAALLLAQRRQPPLHLRDGAVDRGQVLGRAGRQGAVELGQGAGGRQGFGALDQVAFELAAQVALEPAQLGAVDRRPLLAVLARRLRPGGQPEGAADPLHVDADHARALAAAEGGDRQPRQVPHPVLVAFGDRFADLLAELFEVDPLAFAAAALAGPLAVLADPALDRLGLGGAEEVAVEEQLEDAAVVLGLGDRRRQRLAEVGMGGPLDVFERGEGVEDLRGADRDALVAQLLAEAEQLGGDPGRPRVSLRPVGRYARSSADNRWMRAAPEQDGRLRALREMRGDAAASLRRARSR